MTVWCMVCHEPIWPELWITASTSAYQLPSHAYHIECWKQARSLYVYRWRNNAKRAEMYGRQCVVVARLAMNSAAVRFTDNGQEEIVSRNALRRVRG